jgi:Bardet-Biedl syndrome 9 protein
VDADSSLSVSQSSKRVLPEWSFNIGECALGIQTTQRIKNTPQTILVLGERNLFCLNDNGQLLFMSKFEYSPSSFIVYTNETKNDNQIEAGIRYIIGTHSHTLFIVQDAHIRWAAHIDSVPIQIDVCTIQ